MRCDVRSISISWRFASRPPDALAGIGFARCPAGCLSASLLPPAPAWRPYDRIGKLRIQQGLRSGAATRTGSGAPALRRVHHRPPAQRPVSGARRIDLAGLRAIRRGMRGAGVSGRGVAVRRAGLCLRPGTGGSRPDRV